MTSQYILTPFNLAGALLTTPATFLPFTFGCYMMNTLGRNPDRPSFRHVTSGCYRDEYTAHIRNAKV